jgi:hypothetical protein
VQRKENKTGMPDQLKSGIENLSGMGMDDVKVHYNSDKPAQLQAHAFAQGSDIHLAAGQEKHLPHEAWHVVQQRQGRVQATSQLKGVGINDHAGLEQEADEMGAKAMQHDHSMPVHQLKMAGNHANGCCCGDCGPQAASAAQRKAIVQRVKLTKEVIDNEIESENYDENGIKTWYRFYEMVDTDAQAKDVQSVYNGLMGKSVHPSGYAFGTGMLYTQYFKIRSCFFPSTYDILAQTHRDNFVNKVTDKFNNNLWTCPECNKKRRKNVDGEDVTIDHREDCASYWNKKGRDESKAGRIKFYNDTKNHDIMCRSCNSSKNSGGTTYRRMVGPNFTH